MLIFFSYLFICLSLVPEQQVCVQCRAALAVKFFEGFVCLQEGPSRPLQQTAQQLYCSADLSFLLSVFIIIALFSHYFTAADHRGLALRL